ncbi:hypothetical protein DYBT9275_04041 [Dyadobacter sp. CECT 9275]|uniref:Uncharacterized protein n=1 Tax=Dyadobacter helix TaxID=2822344 RepID=A0A916JF35_9BACT|nr:hypothetical protein [Dyadobacter sp. CECT 9275]CAG5007420.1 hypothetical protein DYBT9275_04041 [Dyadobacter sp. CECT 9275]
MSNSLNINALNQYASRFAALVLNQSYRSQDIVTGSELLKITPVRQVNLGILNRLFEEWKGNAEAFRSVYFDFENDEVREALQVFMNKASRHIAVKRADLETLLIASVRDAVILLFTPEIYFEEKISAAAKEGFNHAVSEQLIKYTHIHRNIAEVLDQRLSHTGRDSVSGVQAVNWVKDIISAPEALDAKDDYLAQFAEILPVNTEELLPQVTAAHPVASNPSESKSFFDSAFTELEPALSVSSSVSRAEPVKTILSDIVSKTHVAEKESLNSRFKVNMPKVMEENTYGNVPVKVESIAGSIPLGQRFMFVNQLFNKNSEHFDKAIYELDTVKSYEEAQDLIWHRYASKYAWDVNGEAVTSLLALVKRKFSN